MDLIDLAAVLIDPSNRRPDHVVLPEIIPGHFIDASLQNLLKICVDGLGNDGADIRISTQETSNILNKPET